MKERDCQQLLTHRQKLNKKCTTSFTGLWQFFDQEQHRMGEKMPETRHGKEAQSEDTWLLRH